MKKELSVIFRKYRNGDVISKMDAAKFLKELYPNMTLKEFMEAYKFAYE